jgi:hypothetical protein
MHRRTIKLVPLATALASISGMAATSANAIPAPETQSTTADTSQSQLSPNLLVSTGTDLLGFIITKQSDGTVVAGHSSHASHASHASHVSSR